MTFCIQNREYLPSFYVVFIARLTVSYIISPNFIHYPQIETAAEIQNDSWSKLPLRVCLFCSDHRLYTYSGWDMRIPVTQRSRIKKMTDRNISFNLLNVKSTFLPWTIRGGFFFLVIYSHRIDDISQISAPLIIVFISITEVIVWPYETEYSGTSQIRPTGIRLPSLTEVLLH